MIKRNNDILRNHREQLVHRKVGRYAHEKDDET